MDIKHIYWLAGYLDGEGCFSFKTTPRIQINQVDLDIVQKFKDYSGATTSIGKVEGKHKTMYTLGIGGILAASLMMTIYPLMSKRRQDKIKDVLEQWKEMPNKRRTFSPIEIIAMSRRISIAEATKIWNQNTKEN